MKNKLTYIIIALLFTIVILFSIKIATNYIHNINSFEQVTVNIRGNINENEGQIKVIGITPRGKERVFENINRQIQWYSYYSFYKDIIIACDSNLFKNIDSLNIAIGQKTHHYNKSDFLTKWKIEYIECKTYKNKFYCHIPKEIYTNASIFRKILSVKNWTIVKYTIIIIAIIVILLLAFFYRRFIIKCFKKIISIIHHLKSVKNYFKLRTHKTCNNTKNSNSYSSYLKNYIQRFINIIISIYRFIYFLLITTKLFLLLNIVCLCILMLFIQFDQFFLVGYYLILVFITIIYILTNVFLILFKTKKDVILNTQILLLSVFIILCIVEFSLRKSKTFNTYMESRGNCVYHSHYITTIKSPYNLPDANKERFLSTSEYNFKRYSNSIGLSNKELSIDNNNANYRIIGLGDSFTEGDGTDVDSTWMKFLERNINNKNIEFINAGICGSDPFYEYNLLYHKLLIYKPNLVFVAINHSDISDVIIRGGFERFINDSSVVYSKPPKWEFFYQYIHIVRMVAHNLFKCNEFLLTPHEQKHKSEVALLKIKQVLLDFKLLAKKNNFKIIIIFHPVKSEILDKKFQYFNPLLDFCKKNNIQYINLLDYFINNLNLTNSEINSIFWKHDGHNNAKGYSLFARGVEWKLLQLGIIDTLKK